MKVDSTRTREHDIVARISANAEGQPQVVTTNFDRLFESALAERATPIHKPPMYPDLRHGVPATGITYLHGRLADTESDPHDYILSSADLGRAYLAQGWATAFIQQLLQTPYGRTSRLSGGGSTGTVLVPGPRECRQADGQPPLRVRRRHP